MTLIADNGRLTINLKRSSEDDIVLTLGVETSDLRRVFHGSTHGMQVGNVYLETIGRAFSKCADYASASFGASYYAEPSGRNIPCSLYLSMDWLNIVMRRGHKDRILLDFFVRSADEGVFSYFGLRTTSTSLSEFGGELLSALTVE